MQPTNNGGLDQKGRRLKRKNRTGMIFLLGSSIFGSMSCIFLGENGGVYLLFRVCRRQSCGTQQTPDFVLTEKQEKLSTETASSIVNVANRPTATQTNMKMLRLNLSCHNTRSMNCRWAEGEREWYTRHEPHLASPFAGLQPPKIGIYYDLV